MSDHDPFAKGELVKFIISLETAALGLAMVYGDIMSIDTCRSVVLGEWDVRRARIVRRGGRMCELSELIA